MTTRPPLRNFFRTLLATAAVAAVGSIAKAAPGSPSVPSAPAAGKTGSALTPLGTTTVAINDTIKTDTETIKFSGNAIVEAQIVEDVLTNAPRVLQLLIDFSQVTGLNPSSKQKYISEAQSILHRPLIALDPIQVSFPYHISGDFASARSVIATFSVKFQGAKGVELISKLTPPVNNILIN